MNIYNKSIILVFLFILICGVISEHTSDIVHDESDGTRWAYGSENNFIPEAVTWYSKPKRRNEAKSIKPPLVVEQNKDHMKPLKCEMHWGELDIQFYDYVPRNITAFTKGVSISHVTDSARVKLDVFELCKKSHSIQLVIHDSTATYHTRMLCIGAREDSEAPQYSKYILSFEVINTAGLALVMVILYYVYRRVTKNKELLKRHLLLDHQRSVKLDKHNTIGGNARGPLLSTLLLATMMVVGASNTGPYQHCDQYNPLGNGVTRHTSYLAGNVTKTGFEGYATFTIPRESLSVCMEMVDERGNSMGPLIFKISELKFTTRSRYDYTTSSFFGHVSMKNACNNGRGTKCGKGVCKGVGPNDVDCQGELNSDQTCTAWPGESICDEPYRGEKLSGCMDLLSTICSFSRRCIVPEGYYEDVNNIYDVDYQYKFSASFGGKEVKVNINDPKSDLSISVVTTSNEVDRSLVGKHWMYDHDRKTQIIGDACKRDNPVVGMVGDIQATNDIFAAGRKRGLEVSIANNLWGPMKHFEHKGKVGGSANFVTPGFQKKSQWSQSPLTYGNNIWTFNGREWETHPDYHDLMILTVKFNPSFSLTRVDAEVCAEAKYISKMKDSYRDSSFEGGIIVSVRSVCHIGNVLITNHNKEVKLITPSLNISREWKEYPVRFHTKIKTIKDNFCIGASCFDIDLELSLEPLAFARYGLSKYSTALIGALGGGIGDIDIDLPKLPTVGGIFGIWKKIWAFILKNIFGKLGWKIYIILGVVGVFFLGIGYIYLRTMFFR